MRENRTHRHDHEEDSSSINDLVKKEQDYRHKWQDRYLKAHISTFRLGQIFGLIYNIALLALVYDLIQNGEKQLALRIFMFNAAIIAFAILVTSVERKVLSRKSSRRHNTNNRFRNHSNDRNRNERGGDRDRYRSDDRKKN